MVTKSLNGVLAHIRKLAAEQGPALREASRRAVQEFKKALDEANKKQS